MLQRACWASIHVLAWPSRKMTNSTEKTVGGQILSWQLAVGSSVGSSVDSRQLAARSEQLAAGEQTESQSGECAPPARPQTSGSDPDLQTT